MDIVRKALYYLGILFGVLLALITVISLIPDSQVWYLKILNFPRLQILAALLASLILYFIYHRKWTLLTILFISGVSLSVIIQAYILYPYSPLAPVRVATTDEQKNPSATRLSFLVANVYMHNRQSQTLLATVLDTKPHFFLAMEVNQWWINQLTPLHAEYPYRITYPADNTYGMALYSRLPLRENQIHFFNQDSVPSFHALAHLPGGGRFQLLTIHPVPPKPSQHPDNMGEKEVALLKAGRLIARNSLPALVAGDLNDVGWSHNTHRFKQISGLEDVRSGRGLYNTFNAHSRLMRWPLDYVFVSREFRLVRIERLPAFGSDHFPYFVELDYNPPVEGDYHSR